MKTKNFKDYRGKRLNKNEIHEIEEVVNIEHKALKLLQKDVLNGVAKYGSRKKLD